MAKKQNNKPTLADAAGHFGGFFKTSGLLLVKGVGKTAEVVLNTTEKAFTEKKKAKSPATGGMTKKERKAYNQALATLQNQNKELAGAVTDLRKQLKKKDKDKTSDLLQTMLAEAIKEGLVEQPVAAPTPNAKTKTRAKSQLTI